jgi:hypothetical protein
MWYQGIVSFNSHPPPPLLKPYEKGNHSTGDHHRFSVYFPIGVRHGVSKGVEEGRRPPAHRA